MFDLGTDEVVDLVHEHLFMFGFLDALFHEAHRVSDDLLGQVELNLLTLNALILLLHLQREEVHHVVSLQHFLQLRLLPVARKPQFV